MIFTKFKIVAVVLVFASLTLNAQQKQPNFLFIAIDDLNDHLGFMSEEAANNLQIIYSNPETRKKVCERLSPNIDKLAKSGTSFMRAYTASPVCNPSRAALLTGARPHRSSVYGNKTEFRTVKGMEDRITLPQHLKSEGYYTAGIGKIFHSPKNDKHDIPDEAYSWSKWVSNNVGAHGKHLPSEYGPERPWIAKLDVETEKTHDYLNADFIARVLENNSATIKDFKGLEQEIKLPKNKPFFLACGIFRPHIPYYVPKEYYDMFPIEEMDLSWSTINSMLADMEDIPESGKRFSGLDHGVINIIFEFMRENKIPGGELRGLQELCQAYLASVKYADDCVGRLITALDNSKYKENTVVVLWSDHGWHTTTKYVFDKLTLWEGATRVLFSIRTPMIKGTFNQRCYQPVSLMDIYPTVVDFAGLERPSDIEGESLVNLVKAPTDIKERAILITFGKGNHCLRSGDWKYIRYRNGDKELYNLKSDPWEFINLANLPYFATDLYKLDKQLTAELKRYPVIAKQQNTGMGNDYKNW